MCKIKIMFWSCDKISSKENYLQPKFGHAPNTGCGNRLVIWEAICDKLTMKSMSGDSLHIPELVGEYPLYLVCRHKTVRNPYVPTLFLGGREDPSWENNPPKYMIANAECQTAIPEHYLRGLKLYWIANPDLCAGNMKRLEHLQQLEETDWKNYMERMLDQKVKLVCNVADCPNEHWFSWSDKREDFYKNDEKTE